MVGIPPSISPRRPLLLPPPRSCSDGNVSDMLSKYEGNSNKSMVVDLKCRSSRGYYFRRCKRVRLTRDIDSLPDELLSEILVRLAAHDVYSGARVVCRRWYHLIHSHAFINTHFEFHRCTYGLYLARHYDHNPIYVTATQGKIEISELSYKSKSALLTSCNGLSLVSTLSNNYYIINPATKQLFSLPSCCSREAYFPHSGIAYAAASMEYKVILQLFNQSLFILTVGVDKSWRDVPVEHISATARSLLIGEVPLTTEGFMHWVSKRSTTILTLDVETEILTRSQVPLPPAYFSSMRMYYLSTGSCLSLLVAHKDKDTDIDSLWELWEMNSKTGEWTKVVADIKFGAKKQWRKQFGCRRRNVVLKPIGWVKYREILALHLSGDLSTCIFFNFDTHQMTSIQMPVAPARFGNSTFVHQNTLMWLT